MDPNNDQKPQNGDGAPMGNGDMPAVNPPTQDDQPVAETSSTPDMPEQQPESMPQEDSSGQMGANTGEQKPEEEGQQPQ